MNSPELPACWVSGCKHAGTIVRNGILLCVKHGSGSSYKDEPAVRMPDNTNDDMNQP